RVPIDDEDASGPTEQLRGSLAASVGSEDIQDQLAAAHVIMAMKDPDEAPLAWLLHAHRGLVRQHDGQCRNASAQPLNQRRCELRRGMQDVVHRRARHRNAETLEATLDPIDGNRVGALLHDEERGEAEAILASRDELGWRWCRHDVLPTRAGRLLATMDAPLEVAGHVLVHRARLESERAEFRALALGALLVSVRYRMRN